MNVSGSVVEIVVRLLPLIVAAIAIAPQRNYADGAFYFQQIDVSGGKAASDRNGDAKPGGSGGMVDIRTGIELEPWDEIGPDTGGQIVLNSGAYYYRQVLAFGEGAATIIYLAGDVTIYCKHRFAPSRIMRSPTYDGPVSLTVYAGTPLEFDDGSSVGRLAYHEIGDDVLLKGVDGSNEPSTDADEFTSRSGRVASDGGRFVFWTSFAGGIGRAISLTRLAPLSANGGDGADGGDGGHAGEITLLATGGDIAADIRANGGNGGSNNNLLPHNQDSEAKGYDYVGSFEGGNGGQGGSVAMRARTVEYSFTRWNQITVTANGGRGGAGRTAASTPQTFGMDGQDGGNGGNGGDGGTLTCYFEKPVLDPAAFKLSLDGGSGGTGGTGGNGVGNGFRCNPSGDEIPGEGGKGGHGGHGGLPGKVEGDLAPSALIGKGGAGGGGGRGGSAGAGPAVRTALSTFQFECEFSASGNGGNGGNAGSKHADVRPGDPGNGGQVPILAPSCNCIKGPEPGESGQQGARSEGETSVALREPPTGTEPIVEVSILDAKPKFFIPLLPALPFDLNTFQTRADVFYATQELSQGGVGTPSGTARGKPLPQRIGLVADGTTKLLLVCEATAPGRISVKQLDPEVTNGGSAPAKLSFSWTDDFSRPAIDIPTWPLEEQPLLSGRPRHAAYAIITAPDHIPSTASEENIDVEVVFSANGGAKITNTVPLSLTQPPTLLVHGVWASPDTFRVWNPFLHNHLMSQGLRVKMADYRSTTRSSFSENQGVVGAHIQDLLSDLEKERIAATKVNVVGHSMGGILTRYHGMTGDYANPDNFGEGDVRRLITIDTPHFGSRSASFMEHLWEDCPDVAGLGNVGSWAKFWWTWLWGSTVDSRYGPAVEDLARGSAAVAKMGKSPFPGWAIAGVAASNDPYELRLAHRWLAAFYVLQEAACFRGGCVPCADVLHSKRGYLIKTFETSEFIDSVFREENDRMVELSSQLGGLGASACTKFQGVNHSSVVGNKLVAANVWALLVAPSLALAPHFPAVGGIAPASAGRPVANDTSADLRSVAQGAPRNLPAPPVSITQPPEGTSVSAGSRISLRVSTAADVSGCLIIAGRDDWTEIIAMTNVNLATSWDAPANVLGDYQIQVIPFLPGGSSAAPVSRSLRITTAASISSLTCDWPSLSFDEIGKVEPVRFFGYFTDGSKKELISRSSGIQLSINPIGVIAISPDGDVTSLSNGTATVTAKYGSATLAIPVSVHSKPPLVSAVEVLSSDSGYVTLKIEGLRLSGVTKLRLLEAGAPLTNAEVHSLEASSGGHQLTARIKLPDGAHGRYGVQVLSDAGASTPFVSATAMLQVPNAQGPVISWSVVNNQLVLSWSDAEKTLKLESCTSLEPGVQWGVYTGQITTSENVSRASLPLGGATRFFRLHRQ